MSAKEPVVGMTATASISVGPLDLASALPLQAGDAFPQVFATARMVALMEIASARLLKGYLEPGQLSVGAGIEVKHSAPTPQGVTVTAVATYVGRKGKLFEFEVVASDPGGEIGRSKHTRAMVDAKRLEDLASTRIGGVTQL